MLVPIAIGCRPVGRARQLGEQPLRRLRFCGDPRLEIESRRQAEKGVARPREAIDAAVLASAIGVDRAIEPDIRRRVAGDDPARHLRSDLGAQRRQILVRLPAVVEWLARVRLEPSGVIAGGTACSGARAAGGRGTAFMPQQIEHNTNIRKPASPRLQLRRWNAAAGRFRSRLDCGFDVATGIALLWVVSV